VHLAICDDIVYLKSRLLQTINNESVQNLSMPKVIINGPESSGKTTLCEYLVKKLNAGYIQEYPRIYLEILEDSYNQEDLMIMAQDIDDLISELDEDRLWIIDTNNINIKIWYHHKYGDLPNQLLTYDDNKNAIHLLCKPDIPWEADALRENPEDRDVIFDRYRKYMYDAEIKYHIIEGEDRLMNAFKLVSNNLSIVNMKTMTCKQLGGACDKEFTASTCEERAKMSKEHGTEMFKAGDQLHLDAMSAMRELMHEEGAMEKWMKEKKDLFESL